MALFEKKVTPNLMVYHHVPRENLMCILWKVFPHFWTDLAIIWEIDGSYFLAQACALAMPWPVESPKFWLRHGGGVPSYDLPAKVGSPKGLRLKGPVAIEDAYNELRDRGFLKGPRLLELGKSFYAVKSRHGASLHGVLIDGKARSSSTALHSVVALESLPRCRALLHKVLDLLGAMLRWVGRSFSTCRENQPKSLCLRFYRIWSNIWIYVGNNKNLRQLVFTFSVWLFHPWFFLGLGDRMSQDLTSQSWKIPWPMEWLGATSPEAACLGMWNSSCRGVWFVEKSGDVDQ